MRVMLVGGGGREHAIAAALHKSPKITKMYALPGNGGIAQIAECVAIETVDIEGIVKFAADNAIEFAVVASDDPLALGAVDRLHAIGVPCFGCDKLAAEIEGSKIFAKNLMREFNIPTAKYETFSNAESAVEFLKTTQYPIVIKADGLALGKGVIIAEDFGAAAEAVKSIMIEGYFGQSGSKIVIEEFLKGVEVTLLAFTDGKTVVTMPPATDHKRIGDGDVGANTGGMGVIAPSPFYTREIGEQVLREIVVPTINAMNSIGRKFKGCLYFELMITQSGAKVIEYNCRFGDPEAQTLLPLLETDLLEIMLAVEEERLADMDIKFSSRASACVVAASGGYPNSYKKGFEIFLPEGKKDVFIYHAGTALSNGKLVTKGGRVLGVTAIGDTLEEALSKAYETIDKVCFEGMVYRKDIGKKALQALKTDK